MSVLTKNLLYSLPEDIKDIIVPITQRDNLKSVHIELKAKILTFFDYRHNPYQHDLLSFREKSRLHVTSHNYLISYDYIDNRYKPMTFWKLPFHPFTDLELLTATCDIVYDLIP